MFIKYDRITVIYSNKNDHTKYQTSKSFRNNSVRHFSLADFVPVSISITCVRDREYNPISEYKMRPWSIILEKNQSRSKSYTSFVIPTRFLSIQKICVCFPSKTTVMIVFHDDVIREIPLLRSLTLIGSGETSTLSRRPDKVTKVTYVIVAFSSTSDR